MADFKADKTLLHWKTHYGQWERILGSSQHGSFSLLCINGILPCWPLPKIIKAQICPVSKAPPISIILAEKENLQFVERGCQLIFCGDLLMFGLLQLQAKQKLKERNKSGNFLIKLAVIGSR